MKAVNCLFIISSINLVYDNKTLLNKGHFNNALRN